MIIQRHFDNDFPIVGVFFTFESDTLAVHIEFAFAHVVIVVVIVALRPHRRIRHAEILISQFPACRFPFEIVPQIYSVKGDGPVLRGKFTVFVIGNGIRTFFADDMVIGRHRFVLRAAFRALIQYVMDTQSRMFRFVPQVVFLLVQRVVKGKFLF